MKDSSQKNKEYLSLRNYLESEKRTNQIILGSPNSGSSEWPIGINTDSLDVDKFC